MTGPPPPPSQGLDPALFHSLLLQSTSLYVLLVSLTGGWQAAIKMKRKSWNTREKPWLFTHLQKSFHWTVNGKRLSGSFQRKISESKGTSDKEVLFFRTERYKRKTVFHFFKAMLIPVSGLRGRFTVNGTDCANGKRDSGMKFTTPEFCEPFAQTVDRLVCPCKW